MKIGDTSLMQLHFKITFNKSSMCGTMPYIMFFVPGSGNCHVRIDPDIMWQMAHINEFNGAKNYESRKARGAPPFDMNEVTFESWHFTQNSPKAHMDFVGLQCVGGDMGDAFNRRAQEVRNKYFATASAAASPAPAAREKPSTEPRKRVKTEDEASPVPVKPPAQTFAEPITTFTATPPTSPGIVKPIPVRTASATAAPPPRDPFAEGDDFIPVPSADEWVFTPPINSRFWSDRQNLRDSEEGE